MRGHVYVFDKQITDTERKFYEGQVKQKILNRMEKQENNYLAKCLDIFQYFSPLVYSVDGFDGRKIRATVRKLASFIASKLYLKYSEMASFVDRGIPSYYIAWLTSYD